MKAKLIKVNDYYYLQELSKTGIGGSQFERTLGTTNSQGELGKLSKQNCDDIFGIIDVEKLAEESWGDKISSPYHAYIEGFNKAKELNKDKVFTLEDVKMAIRFGFDVGFCSNSDNKLKRLGLSEDEFIQSIQQPSEIEVEIEQVNKLNIDKGIFEWMPKLDDNGCLTLTKRI